MSKSEYINRELSRAQMIVSSPLGLWPQSLVELSNRVLRCHAGWNVAPLRTQQAPSTTHGTAAGASA